MTQATIKYEDGQAYERGMGIWSLLTGQDFLEWLAPVPGLRWIDIACGTGAFTELIMQRCAPSEIQALDPAEAQLVYARQRSGSSGATFIEGDAMALPFEDGRFDAAVMALALNLMPDPSKGVSEMVRVVRSGGTVSTYIWDLPGGGFPYEPIQTEMRAIGMAAPEPPRADTTVMAALVTLWEDTGLEAIQTRQISVKRNFSDFEDFWSASTGTGLLRPTITAMAREDLAELQVRVRTQLGALKDGPVSHEAHANAIQGRVSKI